MTTNEYVWNTLDELLCEKRVIELIDVTAKRCKWSKDINERLDNRWIDWTLKRFWRSTTLSYYHIVVGILAYIIRRNAARKSLESFKDSVQYTVGIIHRWTTVPTEKYIVLGKYGEQVANPLWNGRADCSSDKIAASQPANLAQARGSILYLKWRTTTTPYTKVQPYGTFQSSWRGQKLRP